MPTTTMCPGTSAKVFFPAYMGQWIFGEYILTRWNPPAKVLAWARFPMLLLMVALGWLIYCLRIAHRRSLG